MHMYFVSVYFVFRSIFIERCVNTELVLACQQLRIHDARNCLFCIHVTSKAIIEDSKGKWHGILSLPGSLGAKVSHRYNMVTRVDILPSYSSDLIEHSFK